MNSHFATAIAASMLLVACGGDSANLPGGPLSVGPAILTASSSITYGGGTQTLALPTLFVLNNTASYGGSVTLSGGSSTAVSLVTLNGYDFGAAGAQGFTAFPSGRCNVQMTSSLSFGSSETFVSLPQIALTVPQTYVGTYTLFAYNKANPTPIASEDLSVQTPATGEATLTFPAFGSAWTASAGATYDLMLVSPLTGFCNSGVTA